MPVREQVYAFGSPLYRLSYEAGGQLIVQLIAGGRMAVQAYAQRLGLHRPVVGRYLGAGDPQPTRSSR